MQEEFNCKLVGRWVTDPTDTDAIKKYGRTTIVFSEDGDLTYIIHGDDRDQVIVMTYRIDDSMLVTDQPSQPGEEHTQFMLTPDGKLVLDYGGDKSTYVRLSD